MTVLIVGSDSALCDVLAFTLQRDGQEVRQAFDAAGVVRQCQQARPDLIVLDLELPNRQGWALCEALGSTKGAASVPVVALAETRTEMVEALRAGAQDCIIKPFSFSEMALRVRNAVNNRQKAPAD
jgi:DNA-binding response OmpR family regulator